MKINHQLLGASLLLIASGSYAHSDHQRSPEDAADYRQAVMESIGWNMGTLKAMLKGELHADKASLIQRANTLKFLSQLPLEGFEMGKASEQAKADIWENWQDFSQKMQNLTDSTARFIEQAQNSPDFAALKPAFAKINDACKSCHKRYKKR